MPSAVIVTALRSAVGKAPHGALSALRPDDLAAQLIQAVLQRTPGLRSEEIDDVILGCAHPEGEQGLNVARAAALRAGLPVSVPGMTLNRFCASGLESIAVATERIVAGHASVILAGGVESMSRIPMGGHAVRPNPFLTEQFPDVYLGMGQTAEVVAEKCKVARADQDAFALESHRRALAAREARRFADEIVPVQTRLVVLAPGTPPSVKETMFEEDECPRRDTSPEALRKLKPVFKAGGTVTAGNSSPLSDGAAMVVVMSEERARRDSLPPLGRLISYAVAGVEPAEMGLGPVRAVPKALALAGRTLADMDLIELNEAFAAQALPVLRQLEMDPARVNVNGGAIAMGHPLGCTGAKLTATLLHELRRRKGKLGLVTMCVGGGMGAAGVFERAD